MKFALVMSVFVSVTLAAEPDWETWYMPAQGAYVHHQAYNLVVDRDGNSYVVGDTDQSDGNVNLVKFSPHGGQGWVASLPESTFDYYNMALALDANQNVIFASNLVQGSSNGFMVAKFLRDGTQQWKTVHWHATSGPVPSSATSVYLGLDQAGGIYVAGTGIAGQTEEDIAVCKFDSTGNFRWARYFDGQRHSYDLGFGLAVAGNGVLVCGYALDEARRANAVVVKYDTAGTLLWSYDYMPNSNYASRANWVGAAQDGSVYAAGNRSAVPGGQSEFLLVKLNSSGDTLWTRTDSGEAMSLAVDSDSGVYVVGDYGRYARTWRYSPTGQLLWRDAYESDTLGKWWGFACLASDHCVYAVGGRYETPTVPPDFRVLKYSPSGQALWEGVYDTTDTYRDELCAAAVGPEDAVYLAGTRTHEAGDYSHYLLMKYRTSGGVEEPTGVPAGRVARISVSPSIVSSRCAFMAPASTRGRALWVADVTGRIVRRFTLPAGNSESNSTVVWDATDERSMPVPDGVYFVTAGLAEGRLSAKLVVRR